MSDPIFFFSYARADRHGARTSHLNASDQGSGNAMDAFYAHLCDHVASLTARPAEEVGFFDQNSLDLGVPWPDRVIDALRSCRVMIAVFSPTYFSRQACGREFEVFRRRHKALQEKLGRAPDYRILPVLWVRPDVTYERIPIGCRDYIRALQRTAPGMPESYNALGLMRMFELSRTTETNIVCHEIADRIYSLLHEEALPRIDRLDFDSLESAFHEIPSIDVPQSIDPMKREVRTYFLVPTRSEWLAATGKDSHKFDSAREKARPFADAPGANILSATEEGITEGKLDLGVSHQVLPSDLINALEETKGSMTTPLIVFDRRALKIPSLKAAASSYCSRNFENAGLVTVAGEEISDPELKGECGAKIGALPKLHNWSVPQGRNTYVRNVASIVVELEAQLVHRQTGTIPPSGEAIPGLSGAGNI
jgi:hypothetical protein